MICSKCGKELPEGVTVCPDCPEEVAANEVEEKVAEPVEEKAEAPKGNPVKKKEFLKTIATKGTKTTSKLVWVAFLVCAVLAVYGAYLALTTPVLEMPAFAYGEKLIGEDDDIVKVMKEFLNGDELYNYAKESYENGLDDMTEEEKALGLEGLERCEEFSKAPNIINARAFYIPLYEMVQHENPFSQAFIEKYSLSENYAGYVLLAFNVVICAILAIAALSVIFLLISAAAKSNALVIITIILNLILDVLLVDFVIAAVVAVLLIVMAILIGSVNGKYRKYKKSFKA